ncbi:hypothetical protein FRX31_022580 [Thalictrum thalictroides]|uniref:Pentatricopeptide repeat-containing protein n=1 Tax=Thalictrum thalictroides TaxID=46969 RepID=A0A7J6VTV9_THATH|nr:hypothetical protein FRX31_022580 [Thalictrum thalictroides]
MLRRMGMHFYGPMVSNTAFLSSGLSCFVLHFRSKTKITKEQRQQQIRFEYFVRDRCKSGTLGFDEALGLFDRLFQMRPLPYIFPFTQILVALVKMEAYPLVCQMSKLMDLAGIIPDSVSLRLEI